MSNPSDSTPERPDDQVEAHPGSPRDSQAEETDGQVSETAQLDRGVVDDGDSVLGSGVDGAVGPDGVPPENRRDNDFKKPGREHSLDERVDDL